MNIKISTVSDRVRLENVEKYLGRNPDAILVKLGGTADPSMTYKPGHVCGIETDDENDQQYNVYVGKHFIGFLPEEAIAFAKQVEILPELLPSIVGKADADGIYIYIAE